MRAKKDKKRKRWSPEGLKRFVLVGDICHPGRVVVEARDLEDALKKVEDGDFVVYDESDKLLAFSWNGDSDTVETLPWEG